MKKFVKTVCCLLILIALATLVLTPIIAYASPPTEMSGTYTFIHTSILDIRQAGGNTIIKDVTNQDLDGDIIGSAIFERTLILHSSGKYNIQGIDTITASVGDRSGTLTLRITGTGDMIAGTVQGKWTILSGTGELANLRGQGVLTGVSNVAGSYSGQIHFDPDK